MKHLALFLFILIFSNNSGLELNNSQHETLTENYISAEENLEETTNSATNIQFVRVEYYSNTTQEQINESIATINPINYLMCANDSHVYVITITTPLTIQGEGRSRGSAGSGGTNNAIHGDPYVQSYSFGRMCD